MLAILQERRMRAVGLLGIFLAVASALADGMVVPQVFYPKVEIPNQQALLCFSNGMERLVIETSFLGEGTNFAWVVPLPAVPEVKPVSENLFSGLRQAFQPRLVHRVRHYYAGVLLLCGLIFLGCRSLRSEVSWVVDLPLCLLLSVGGGIMGRSVWWGLVTAYLALGTRLFGRDPAMLALLLIVGTTLSAALTFAPSSRWFGLIETMGPGDALGEAATIAGVSVVSVQRAGVFEITTIRGSNPRAVQEWLQHNGYEPPAAANPAIRHYIERGWVFVASKVRCDTPGPNQAVLHPLSFTFSTHTPVYPTRLTAVDNGSCAIDLYVFGMRRTTARHFEAARCDWMADNLAPDPKRRRSGVRLAPEPLALVGNSTVGTKLSARLSPRQMAADVEIRFAGFRRKGATVFSYSGARTIALNVAVPLAVLGCMLAGTTRGGWKVSDKSISSSRWRLLAVAAAVGLATFLLLPKVEVVTHPVNPTDESLTD